MRLPTIKPNQLIKALKRAGFIEYTQKGSHLVLKNMKNNRRTVVPVHAGDIKRSLMKLIIKQAGLTDKEFKDLL